MRFWKTNTIPGQCFTVRTWVTIWKKWWRLRIARCFGWEIPAAMDLWPFIGYLTVCTWYITIFTWPIVTAVLTVRPASSASTIVGKDESSIGRTKICGITWNRAICGSPGASQRRYVFSCVSLSWYHGWLLPRSCGTIRAGGNAWCVLWLIGTGRQVLR